MGVSHCLNRTLSLSIEDNNVDVGKRKVVLGLLFILGFTVVIIINVASGHEIYLAFFGKDKEIVQHIQDTEPFFVIVLLVGGVQTILQGVMKTLQIEHFWKMIVFCFYVLGLGFAILLSFEFKWKLLGIWGGWLIGIFVLFVYEIRYLLTISWTEWFDKVRAKYRVIEDNIRASRI